MRLLNRRSVITESLVLSVFYAGLIGGFTGLAVARLIISSHEIIAVLVDYLKQLFSLMISLIIVHYLFKYIFKKRTQIAWRITKQLILLNFVIIFAAIVYVLFFNLLSMYYYPNPLLALCTISGRLSDADLQIAGYGIMVISGMLNLGLSIKYAHSLKVKSHKAIFRRSVVCLLLLLVSLSIIIPLYMSSSIDSRYGQVLMEFKNYNIEYNATRLSLEYLWDFVLRYKSGFDFTYRMPCPKPRQLLVRIPSLMDDKDFVAKLAVVARTGACFDFAISIAKLIRDLYGYETRVVSFIGWDHAIPEVKINGTWYIIDAAYTTPNYPVDIDHYIMYLQKNYSNIYNNLKGLVDFETGEDLSKEHHLEP